MQFTCLSFSFKVLIEACDVSITQSFVQSSISRRRHDINILSLYSKQSDEGCNGFSRICSNFAVSKGIALLYEIFSKIFSFVG